MYRSLWAVLLLWRDDGGEIVEGAWWCEVRGGRALGSWAVGGTPWAKGAYWLLRIAGGHAASIAAARAGVCCTPTSKPRF